MDERTRRGMAIMTHAILATGHMYGAVWHLLSRKGSRRYAAIHTAALIFDAVSTARHIREAP